MPRTITLNTAAGGSAGGGSAVNVPAEIIAHNNKNGVENLIRRYVFSNAQDPNQRDILIDDNIDFNLVSGYKVRIRNVSTDSNSDLAWHMPGGGTHYWYNSYRRHATVTSTSSNSTNGFPWTGGSNIVTTYNSSYHNTVLAEIYLDSRENKYISWFTRVTPGGEQPAYGTEGCHTGYTQNAWTSINFRPYSASNLKAPTDHGPMTVEVYKINRVTTPLNDGGIST